MANKKKPKASTERQLKAKVKTLKVDLADAKAKRDKWKKRARAAETEVADLRHGRKQAETTVGKPGRPAGKTVKTLPVNASDDTSAPPPTRITLPTPDESWTLTALREEARRRGITGLSGKPKADVLTALRT